MKILFCALVTALLINAQFARAEAPVNNYADQEYMLLLKHSLETTPNRQPGSAKDAVPQSILPRMSLNLKGAKFGDVLRALSQIGPFNYSINSSPVLSPSGGWQQAQPIQQSPDLPSRIAGDGQSSSAQGQIMYDINVNFSYSGDSIDDAIGLLCKGADVYCEKKKDLWVITRHEVYIIDKDVFFTYSVSGGAAGGGITSGASQPAAGAATVSQQPAATAAAAAIPAGTPSGADSIGISGNFDDFVQFIKAFLSKDGSVQISKSGFLVVVDVPSAIAKIRKVMGKDLEMTAKAGIKVDVIRVDNNDNYSAGVDWNAVMKKVAINGSFAPANAFTFAYNTTKAGSPVSALLGALGKYGNSEVVKSWETSAMSGIPVFFNVTENIPYFTQSMSITTGVSQTATQVNYVNVGLKIKILPNIRQDTLNGGIYAETSELVSMQSSGGQSPTTAPTTSLTNTALPLDLKWGSSLVLTGFKTKQKSFTANGVPWLSKIPFIGALFGYQEKDSIGSEIAIVVTATKQSEQGGD